MIVTLLVTFLLTPFGGDPSGRYFLPLYYAAGDLHCNALATHSQAKCDVASLLLALLVGYNVAGTLAAAAKNPPGITTQFDPVTWIDHTRDQELIDFLLAQRRDARLYQLLGADADRVSVGRAHHQRGAAAVSSGIWITRRATIGIRRIRRRCARRRARFTSR